ncbi:hypothetical protein ES703_56109 [subsurface metagenome]
MKKGIMSNKIRICAIILLTSYSAIGAEMGEFNPVEPNRIPETLTMISNRIQSNYDQIKTWQGKEEVIEDYIYEGAKAERLFKTKTDGLGEIPSQIRKHTETIIEFSLDAEKGFKYANYYPIKPLQYADLKSLRDLGAKGIAGRRRNIVTPEYQIDCTGDTMRDGIVMSRRAVKQARPKNNLACAGNLDPVYDPRISFKAFGNQIWQLFPMLVELIKKRGKYSVDEYDLKVEERKSGDITEYRIILPSKGGSPESYQYFFSRMVFSSDKGFNIISYQHTVQNGILLRNRTWNYDFVDGVHVPKIMTQQDFNWPNGTLRHERIVTFKNQKVNKPISAETFTYKNLGLKNGDKFIDKILYKEYTYQDEKLIPASSGSSHMLKKTNPIKNLNRHCKHCRHKWKRLIILASHWLDS